MVIDLKTRYKLAGLESEKTMESQVHIWTTVEGLSKGQVGAGNDGKLRITKVEDRWNGGELPEGPFAKVGLLSFFSFYGLHGGDEGLLGLGKGVGRCMNPFWWGRYWRDVGFWVLGQVWETRGWEVSREHLLASHPFSATSGGSVDLEEEGIERTPWKI